MIRNVLLRAALLLALLLPAAPALADQGSLCLPTVGTVSGLTVVQDVNAGLQALVTANSGSSAPANPCGGAPLTGQLWLDGSTSPAHVRMFDGANWLDQGALDASNHLWEPPVGGGVGSLASASTTNLGSVAPAYVAITGTTAITSFGSSAQTGTVKFIRFAAALTLTYNATSLITPTAASITTAAGDHAIAAYMGGGNWRVVDYVRGDGTPIGLIQTVNIAASAVTSAKIATNAVANSNLAQASASTIKGNNSSSTANEADLTTAQVRVLPGLALQGQRFGLTLSNDGSTPASVIDIAPGEAASDTSAPTLLVLGAAVTKSVTSSWAAGSTHGCWDTGSVSSPSTVHFFIIGKADGTIDELCSASISPTMPSGYVYKRRIGSDLYQSSALLAFVQDDNRFIWNTSSPPQDWSGTTRSKSALTVSVPSGIRVMALFNAYVRAPFSTGTMNIYDGANGSISTQLISQSNNSTTVGVQSAVGQSTNTSSQIQLSVAGADSSGLTTLGWVDTAL